MGAVAPGVPAVISGAAPDLGDQTDTGCLTTRPSDPKRRAYIMRGSFIRRPKNIMEAEQLNIIESRLADLAQRATELRRYL